MNIQEQIDKRANVWAQMQEMRDAVDKDGWTAELRASWDAADTELVELTSDIERSERDKALTESLAVIDERITIVDPDGGNVTRDEYREVFVRYLRHGLNDLEPQERQLVQANQVEMRAQGAGVTTAGGFTVPEGFWAKVTETLKWYGGINEEIADFLPTDSGNAIPWPTNDGTAIKGAILAENTQITEGDEVFGQKTLGAYMYTSKLIRVSLQLLQDSGIDIEGFLARRIGERLGRIENEHFTTGTGTGQPQGFVTGATVGVTAASATAITLNELIDLEHSVDVAYRMSGRGRWEMNDLVAKFVRKIRDDSGGVGIGRPIWEPSVQVGQPSALLGYPVTINNDMAPALVAAAKTVAFGDFKAAYALRRVNGGQVMRLAERYADFLQVGFFGFQRADGLVQDPSAVKVLQQL